MKGAAIAVLVLIVAGGAGVWYWMQWDRVDQWASHSSAPLSERCPLCFMRPAYTPSRPLYVVNRTVSPGRLATCGAGHLALPPYGYWERSRQARSRARSWLGLNGFVR